LEWLRVRCLACWRGEHSGGQTCECGGRANVANGMLPLMRSSYTCIIERDVDTGLLVGYVPGFPGAHSQGETLDELQRNLHEVIEMLLEDGPVDFEGEFVGTQLVTVG
jgi:predicted RNase H-like HicB family nuclease